MPYTDDNRPNYHGKHPGGRPRKYRKQFCRDVIEFCKDGYSLTSYAAHIEVGRDTILDWTERYPEFSLAVEIAKGYRLHAWEGRARTIVEHGGTGGQAALAQFMLKNHGPDEFKDRHEVSHTGQMTLEQLLVIGEQKAEPKVIEHQPVKPDSER